MINIIECLLSLDKYDQCLNYCDETIYRVDNSINKLKLFEQKEPQSQGLELPYL